MQIFANEIIPLAQEIAKSRLNGGANGKTNGNGDASARASTMARGHSPPGIPPGSRGGTLSESSATKDDGDSSDGLHHVHLYVREAEVSSDELVQLRETLLEHHGPCAVVLHLFASGKGETVIELPDQMRVASTPEFEATVQRLFGSRVSFHSLES